MKKVCITTFQIPIVYYPPKLQVQESTVVMETMTVIDVTVFSIEKLNQKPAQ